MDELPDKRREPLCLHGPLLGSSLGLSLRLLLLLGNVFHLQCLVPSPHCPEITLLCKLPNCTSHAGSAFFCKLHLPALLRPMQHYQLTLADGEGLLPHWMVFRHPNNVLAGLALNEDCGIYRLKVSVNSWQCKGAAYFYLHIQNKTVNGKESPSHPKSFTCSDGETTIWADLLLQLNPGSLGANERVSLVTTMADYLRLPPGSIHLFSVTKSFDLLQGNLSVCMQGGMAKKLTATRGQEKEDIFQEVSELLWTVGCGGEEQQSSLAKVLEHSTNAGGLARLLGAPILGWRVLDDAPLLLHKVKRELRPKHTPTPNIVIPPPTRVQEVAKRGERSLTYFPLFSTRLILDTQNPRFSAQTITEDINHKGKKLEPTQTKYASEVTIISASKGFCDSPQLSGTQGDDLPASLLHSFMVAPEQHLQTEKMYRHDSGRMSAMDFSFLMSSPIQTMQVPSPSLTSMEVTVLHPDGEYSHTIRDTQLLHEKIFASNFHTLYCMNFACSLPSRFSAHSSEEYSKQTELFTSDITKPEEVMSSDEQYLEVTLHPVLLPLLNEANSRQASTFQPLKPTSATWLEHVWNTELFLSNTKTELSSQGDELHSGPVKQLMENATADHALHLEHSQNAILFAELSVLGSTTPTPFFSSMATKPLPSFVESLSAPGNSFHTMLVEKTFVRDTLSLFLPSFTQHSIYPLLPTVAPSSYSVTPIGTHDTLNRESLVAGQTPNFCPKEKPLLTESHRSTLTDSETQSAVSSLESVNLPPRVLHSIPTLTATIGFPFHYSIPPRTFLDPEDGEADNLSLEMRFMDGPPVNVGTWLLLDGLELHGIPLEVDLDFAPQDLLLAARDRWGLSTWLSLTVDLLHSPVHPCHTFTITAHHSLHSVLIHRRRVELLLRKLSRFFNSSGGHHLSVVSVVPGSTVVSWYNFSLCASNPGSFRRCHVGQIQSMWLKMASTQGQVNTVFSNAMLPEFLITQVGPVSYRPDCFPSSTTSQTTPTIYINTLNPGLDTNSYPNPTSDTSVSTTTATETTAQQKDPYWGIASMLTALLVVCLLILIVVLTSAILHFCKDYGRRTVAIWPAKRVLSVHNTDEKALRPRLPPLFQPEFPPPPLKLWINLSQGNEEPLTSTYMQDRQALNKAIPLPPPQYQFHPQCLHDRTRRKESNNREAGKNELDL